MTKTGRQDSSVRILVVDDDPDTLDLVKLTLATAGFDVVLAAGGTDALRMIHDFMFDLVLLDIMMPDESGFEVMRKLRNAATLPPTVIILSALGTEAAKKTGEELGAFKYLVKPVSRGDLLDAVHSALGDSSNDNQSH
jgi:DNA-binding response OmpR family regulator